MIKEISENDIAECVDVIRRSFCTVAEEFGVLKKWYVENGFIKQ